MSCNSNTPNVNKTFIIEPQSLTGGTPVLSACTSLYTNLIQACSGGTVNFSDNINISGAISGVTYYGDGSKLTGISTVDNFVSGGTYNSGSTVLEFVGNSSATTFNVDVSELLDNTNYYVTNAQFSGSTLILTRNGGLSALTSEFTATTVDTFVSAGTFNQATAAIDFSGNSSGTTFSVQLNSLTANTYTNNSELVNNTIFFDTNLALSAYSVDLTPLVFTGNTSGDCITDLHISNLYGCSPITTHDKLILLSGLTFSSITKDNSLIQILGRNSTTGDVEYRDVSSIITGATSTITASNGLTKTGDNITLGGVLTGDTTINIDNNTFALSGGSVSMDDGTGINIGTNIIDGGSGFFGSSNYIQLRTKSDYSEPWFYMNGSQSTSSIGKFFQWNLGDQSLDIAFTFAKPSANHYQFNNNQFALYDNSGSYKIWNYFNRESVVGFIAAQGIVNSNVNGSVAIATSAVTMTANYTLYTDKLNLVDTPTNNDLNTNILTRNTSTGNVEYRDVSSIINAASADTYTTSANLSGDSITFDNNLGGVNVYNVDLLPLLSGKTNNTHFDSYTSATETILNTKVEDGNNVGGATEIFSGKSGTILNFRTLSGGSNTTLTTVGDVVKIDVSIPTDQDTQVTAFTWNQTTFDLTIKQNGLSDETVNLAVLATDIYVVSGSYSANTGIVRYTNSTGGTFDVSGFTTGMTDTYTTDANLSGNSITFDRNIGGGNVYNVDLLPLLSGKTNNTDFNTYTAATEVIIDSKADQSAFTAHTGDTSNPHLTAFSSLTTTAHTHTLNDITDFDAYSGNVQTILDSKTDQTLFDSYSATTDAAIASKVDQTLFDSYSAATEITLATKVDGGINIGNGAEIFSGKSGTTLVFRTLSGGTNTTVTTIGGLNVIDVVIPTDQDTQVTAFTWNPTTFDLTIEQNGLSDETVNLSILATDIYVVSGVYDPLTGIVTYTNSTGGTFPVSGFTTGMTDSYTTSASLSGDSITFDNNIQGSNIYNVSLLPLLSGKTDVSVFNTYTGDTEAVLLTKVEDGNNVGSGAGEIFSGKSGTTLNFRTLSGGSNTTLTTVGDVVKIDVAVPSGDNFFSTAGTVTQSATTGSTEISLQIVGTSGFTPYTITGLTDTFVNDFTFSSNTFTITQNDGSSFDSSVETIELGNILSAVTFDIGTSGSISATTFNGDTFSGGTFYGDGTNLSGIDNLYVTGGTVTGETTIVLTRNDNVNIPVTGITSTGLFGQHTGDTNNPHVVTISQLSGVSETLFNTYTGDTETVLLTKVEDGNNVGGATEIFRDKTGTTLNFRTLSGGTNTTVTTIGDINRIDVSIPTDLNTFVTGFTYNDNNTFTIFDNVGSAFTATINQVSGLTVNGTLSATTLDGSILLSGGTNLLTIIDDRDTFVTGTTFTGNQSILSRNDGSDVLKISGGTNVTITSGGTNLTVIDVSIPLYNNTFVSGGTYSDSTDIITFTNTTGGTFNVTGITDTFVTGGTYSSGTTSLDFSGNTGFIPFSVNVSELIDDTNTFVTGFTYNDANTFTISNNNGTNYSASIDVMSGLTVNGESVFSGTGTDVVQIYGSGSTTPIFRVEGSSGELFSISDSLIGDLFTVNNISGLPILVVNSDNTILWGDNTVPSLNTTVKKSINSGLTEIYSVPVSAYTGVFFDYTVTGAGARAGSISSIFSGTSVQFNETTTNDIGDTSGITFDMNISGGTANLTVSATTNSWEIRTIVRSI